MYKYCSKCHKYKPIFVIDKNKNYYCRECLIKLLENITILELRKLKLIIERREGG